MPPAAKEPIGLNLYRGKDRSVFGLLSSDVDRNLIHGYISSYVHCDHTRALILFTILCLPGIAFLSDAHSHVRTERTRLEHTAAVYHELARRDIANGPLMDALSRQTDVGEISRKLQLKDLRREYVERV